MPVIGRSFSWLLHFTLSTVAWRVISASGSHSLRMTPLRHDRFARLFLIIGCGCLSVYERCALSVGIFRCRRLQHRLTILNELRRIRPRHRHRVCRSTLRFDRFNIRSLLRIVDYPTELFYDYSFDLLCLAESWQDKDSAIIGRLCIAGFNVLDYPACKLMLMTFHLITAVS